MNKEKKLTKKYQILKEKSYKKEWIREGKRIILHRIKANINIPEYGIKKGDIGGWIESEDNLSQDGKCWVEAEAKVYGNAKVMKDARAGCEAIVAGEAVLTGEALVCGNAIVEGAAEVTNQALITDCAHIHDRAKICGSAEVRENAQVYGSAEARAHVVICRNAVVKDMARVGGCAQIGGAAFVGGTVKVEDQAEIGGTAEVSGEAYIYGDAKIHSSDDYIVFKNWWSSGGWITYTRSNKKWAEGCFHGTAQELLKKALEDSIRSYYEYSRLVEYVNGCEFKEREEGRMLRDRYEDGFAAKWFWRGVGQAVIIALNCLTLGAAFMWAYEKLSPIVVGWFK